MTPVRAAGSALSLVTGVCAALGWRVGLATASSTPLHPVLGAVLFVAGALLVVVALVSLVGPRATFVFGVIVSLVILGAVAYRWGRLDPDYAGAVALLSLLAAVVDAVASASSRELSEKDSPLNLPVFG